MEGDLEALQARKAKLKARIKKMKEEGRPDDEIAPEYQKYDAVSQRIKELADGGGSKPTASGGSKPTSSVPTTADLEAEKAELKVKVKTLKAEGAPEAQIQKAYDRYMEVKALLDKGGGAALAEVPPSVPAPNAGASKEPSLAELKERKDRLKAQVKQKKEASRPADEIQTCYDEYVRVKALIDARESGAGMEAAAAPPNTAPKATPTPAAAAAAATPKKEAEADVDVDSKLWEAAKAGDAILVSSLLEKKASIDVSDPTTGATPLCIAVHCGHEDVAQLLLDKDADIEARTANGATPLFIAAQCRHQKLVQLLLGRGADKDAAKDNGMTPLWIAAQAGALGVLQLLVNRGARLDIRKDDGITPLSIAAESGRRYAVKMLVEAGADVEAQDGEGFTALCGAVMEGHLDVVAELLDAKANVDHQTHGGDTPLSIAESISLSDIVQLLRARGASR